MQAIEFIARVKDGVIELPKEYINTIHDQCRIIILLDTKIPKKTTPKKKKLSALKIQTKGLVFDRDEANER
ncbi:MAG TPA: hypothetical protein VGW78_05875 [Candidatus Babeliales bacterium]|jgi:hypothetical protein|nr:hypothetical protein [Candidatus Babeliales bacterium]